MQSQTSELQVSTPLGATLACAVHSAALREGTHRRMFKGEHLTGMYSVMIKTLCPCWTAPRKATILRSRSKMLVCSAVYAFMTATLLCETYATAVNAADQTLESLLDCMLTGAADSTLPEMPSVSRLC